MGADLIVYTLVGPPRLKPSKKIRKKALKAAIAKVDAAKLLQTWADADVAGPKLIAEIKAAEKLILGSGVETEEIEDIARLDPMEVYDAFFNLWENGARDASARPVTLKGTKYQILVAGEMSWGDSPEGDGYLTIQNADKLGIIDALGIK